jgi:hypothetical protein
MYVLRLIECLTGQSEGVIEFSSGAGVATGSTLTFELTFTLLPNLEGLSK